MVWIKNEINMEVIQALHYVIRSVAHDDDDIFNPCCSEVLYATVNYRCLAERKERFESTHAARAAGS